MFTLKTLLWIGVGYFAVDMWLLSAFWMVKEYLVGWHVLWFQIPLTGILYSRRYYDFISSLPGFQPIQFYLALTLLPCVIIIASLMVFCEEKRKSKSI